MKRCIPFFLYIFIFMGLAENGFTYEDGDSQIPSAPMIYEIFPNPVQKSIEVNTPNKLLEGRLKLIDFGLYEIIKIYNELSSLKDSRKIYTYIYENRNNGIEHIVSIWRQFSKIRNIETDPAILYSYVPRFNYIYKAKRILCLLSYQNNVSERNQILKNLKRFLGHMIIIRSQEKFIQIMPLSDKLNMLLGQVSNF